jgi:hypothetical protein
MNQNSVLIGEIASIVYLLNEKKRASYWLDIMGHCNTLSIMRAYSKKEYRLDRVYYEPSENNWCGSYYSIELSNTEKLQNCFAFLRLELELGDYNLNTEKEIEIKMSISKAKELGLYE